MKQKKKVPQKFIELNNAWNDFDATTAYGCAQGNIPYDKQRCMLAFKAYNDVFVKYYPGAGFPSPFNNLEIN